MKPLHLPPTDKTPEVRFDPGAGLLALSGCSIHENADAFYRPLLEAVEQYAQAPAARTTVRMAMTYFNSSSSKYLLDLLRLIDEVHAAKGTAASVEWHFEEGDLDMEEAGADYRALLEMPVELVAGPIR